MLPAEGMAIPARAQGSCHRLPGCAGWGGGGGSYPWEGGGKGAMEGNSRGGSQGGKVGCRKGRKEGILGEQEQPGWGRERHGAGLVQKEMEKLQWQTPHPIGQNGEGSAHCW